MSRKTVSKKVEPTENILGYMVFHDDSVINDRAEYDTNLGDAEIAAEEYANDNDLENGEELVIYKLVKVQSGEVEYERKVNW